MNKLSNAGTSHTDGRSSQSLSLESPSSDFSLSKTKKIQRRVSKKKITKIVHTYCFLVRNSQGKYETIYYQQQGESCIKHSLGLRNMALKQLRENASRMIELAKQKAGLPDGGVVEGRMRNEEDRVQGYVGYYQPSQYYFVF